MRVLGIIPVRLESTRLPSKALKDICGLPAIVHTYKRSSLAKCLDDLYVATDSKEIASVVRSYGGKVQMTGEHRNGSERIEEAVRNIECDIVINIQGDEVLIDPCHIDAIAKPLLDESMVEFTLGVTPFGKANSPSDFKCVLDEADNLLYCSRADIPYAQNGYANSFPFLKAVFVVGFRKSSLQRFVCSSTTQLEEIEPNEFIRILEKGEKIRVVRLEQAHISLDTKDDLMEIRQLMEMDEVRSHYQP